MDQKIIDAYRDLTGYVFLDEALSEIDELDTDAKVALFNRLVAQIPTGAAEDSEIFCLGDGDGHAHTHEDAAGETLSNRAQLFATTVASIAEALGIDLHVSDETADEGEVLVVGGETEVEGDVDDDGDVDDADEALTAFAESTKTRASKAHIETAEDRDAE